jgi:hypothetical protein
MHTRGCTQILHSVQDDKEGRSSERQLVINYQLSILKKMKEQSVWQKILQVVITVLTAIATTFGVTSCMGYR